MPDIKKQLIYKLCEFLIEKRKTPEGNGIRRIFSVPLSEFEFLLDYAPRGNRADKWNALKETIIGLTQEEEIDGRNRLLETDNTEEAFMPSNEGGVDVSRELSLRYDRREIESFMEALKERDEEIRREDSSAIRPAIETEAEHLTVRFQGREMVIGRTGAFNISQGVCQLLFGHEAETDAGQHFSIQSYATNEAHAGDVDAIDDYEPWRDEVSIAHLAKILFGSGWTDIDQTGRARLRRRIRDVLRRLNGQARRKLGTELFQMMNGGREVKLR